MSARAVMKVLMSPFLMQSKELCYYYAPCGSHVTNAVCD